MMNLNNGPYHKIWTVAPVSLRAHICGSEGSRQQCEGGYTLVALLAVMTVIALLAAAAAPSIRQQAEREREIETIFRGEQVAEAIRVYYSYQQGRVGAGDAALPTSIDQLLEGVPSGTKKIQILRASAAIDPLSDSGEWKLIRPRSMALSDFTQAIMTYSANIRPITRDPQLQQQEQYMAPPVLPTGVTASSGASSGEVDNSKGPFIGVASGSHTNSVIYYYGIDRHDAWIFTPLFR
jgi:type II secretory pathway pseudopilin PulG